MPTPIRTRGRRKTPNDGAPKPIPSGPKGGRPMLPPEAKRASSQAGRNKRARLLVAKLSAPRPRKKLSRLESLPVELIEKIFLYSLNVNLPRCSRSIATAVSSERIYRALLLLALWDNDLEAVVGYQWPTDSDIPELDAKSTPEAVAKVDKLKKKVAARKAANTATSRLLRPLEYFPLSGDERRSLQISIFNCRWCTIERLQSQLPDLMRLNIWSCWLRWAVNMSAKQKDRLLQFLAQSGGPCDFECPEEDGARWILSIVPLVALDILRQTPELSHLPWSSKRSLPVLGLLYIPDKFLRGATEGFSEAHTRGLEYLRVAGGLDHPTFLKMMRELNFSREALQQGIHTALIEHNAKALTTLLKLDEYTFRYEDRGPSLPYTLPPDHFRTAVRVARDDPSLFQLLLRTSAESVPSDDSEITQWAIALDGAFGPWLLDWMLQSPERARLVADDPTNAPMFYFGRLNTQLPIAVRYLHDVLGLEELGEWIEETPYDISSDYVVEDDHPPDSNN
ncbi:uncharacterized protein BDV17DRAFT_124508 [Aspergillus undulatus]|uniref:uncharacterized protein n=1 Tax=Aspergillus undulatus TaxID=1810928 RepID=UPI003CCDBEA7